MEPTEVKEKRKAYLDHNILIRLSMAKTEDFCLYLKENFQVIFSLETINEVKRSVGYEDKLIDVLNRLDALYLDVLLDSDNRISDTANIYSIDVKGRIENDDPDNFTSDELIAAGKLFSLKMMGGKPEMKFDEIIDIQESAFSKHMDMLEALILDVNLDQIQVDTKAMREKYASHLAEIRGQLKQHHNSGIGFGGIDLFRKELKVSPQILNNISFPNVFQKIWEILKKRDFVKKSNVSLSDLVGAEKNWAYPGKQVYFFDKMIFGYGFLNSVGYYPDEDLKKDNGFRSSTSDQSHAGYGAFANFLLTWDDRFAKKTKAVYEYFGINTEVVNFNEL
jgi:hypothetical protein